MWTNISGRPEIIWVFALHLIEESRRTFTQPIIKLGQEMGCVEEMCVREMPLRTEVKTRRGVREGVRGTSGGGGLLAAETASAEAPPHPGGTGASMFEQQ